MPPATFCSATLTSAPPHRSRCAIGAPSSSTPSKPCPSSTSCERFSARCWRSPRCRVSPVDEFGGEQQRDREHPSLWHPSEMAPCEIASHSPGSLRCSVGTAHFRGLFLARSKWRAHPYGLASCIDRLASCYDASVPLHRCLGSSSARGAMAERHPLRPPSGGRRCVRGTSHQVVGF